MQRETETLGARPNGRPAGQLLVNHQDRKPLFSSTTSRGDENAKEHDSRRASLIGRPGDRGMSGGENSLASIRRTKSTSESQSILSNRRDSNVSIVSSGGTRIPRLNSLSLARRRPMTLAEAWRMAQGEEGAASDEGEIALGNVPVQPVDGSPSPAPRPWRTRTASDESNLRKILGEDHLDTKGQSKPQSVRHSLSSGTLVASKEIGTGSSASRSPVVSRPMGAGRGIVRMASNESLSRSRPSDWKSPSVRSPARLSRFGASRESLNGGDSGIPDLVPGIEDMTRPSIERPSMERPSTIPRNPSPEKSFAWQVDEDFTAGDLQVSESPRIRIGARPFGNRLLYDDNGKLNLDSVPRLSNPGSRNTKLDEIMSRELQAGSNLPVLDRSRPRPQNTKLDDIRSRESQVEHQIPIPSRHLERLRNTKLDEIRQREADGLSRRAFAAARLEEIREQNSMSRAKSPEEPRPQSSRALRRQSSKSDPVQESIALPARPKTAFEEDLGRQIPDTPVTIFKRDPRFAREAAAYNLDKADIEEREQEDDGDAQLGPDYRRIDEQDLLRRLARAASSSPSVAETKAEKLPTPPPPGNQITKTNQNNTDRSEPDSLRSRRASDNARKTTSGIVRDSEKPKPVVGFTGLQRTRSDSTKSKRSSMQSEPDPTDRIEAEMNLFAPAENQSERGSVRAPSPPPDSDDEKGGKDEDRMVDATPKPTKPDPLTMPTPRITGAYVETPATVKVEKMEVREEPKPRAEARPTVEEKPVKPEPPAPILRDRRASLAWRSKDQDTASDPGAPDDSDVGITTSAAVRRPRAKSLPRRRPPMKNSAKPPSVKDDILELQRAYNIEDSTFEDLGEVLLGHKAALRSSLPVQPSQLDFEVDFDFKTDLATDIKKEKKGSSEPEASDGELAVINRMSKSLRTGLSSIRSAKQGIERLEGHFSQVEKPPLQSKLAAETASSDMTQDHGHHNHRSPEKGCPHCAARPNPLLIAYLHLPIPRLFYMKPKFRFSLLGLVLLVLSIWSAAESTMCSLYCRPTTCVATSKTPCVWSFDDPTTFGTAIPIKLDQWITGGYGREMFSHAYEEAYDWVADMQDLALGRDPTSVDMEKLSYEQKRRLRRRLRKKGLAKPAKVPTPEEKAKWDAWHEARLAKQRAKEAREMGYVVDNDADAAVGGDQRVG